ncbi:unnamed protein product [Tuber melanosporum]|uniref:(Perigord truffle) hypothetical protein n=1 Tax=Tuber melanosporum (strain Mel28) TaxID=656061 RepID=D5G7E0_TUBMM|nr:unnamed protein product [Tuber melanosporum]
MVAIWDWAKPNNKADHMIQYEHI